TRTVKRGDNLSKIAKEVYGDPDMWPLIALANGIDRPDMIKPGQELLLPPAEDINPRLVHKVAGEFYAVKEQGRQEREQAIAAAAAQAAASSVTAPTAAAPAPVAATTHEETIYDPMSGLPMGTITVSDGDFVVPREGAAGVAAGVIGGTGRFLKNTVEGLWDLGKNTYQSYDYAITGNPASKAGYDKLGAIADGPVSPLS